jgi:hypothetical protein
MTIKAAAATTGDAFGLVEALADRGLVAPDAQV